MASTIIGSGPYDWSMSEDEEGHRDYQVQWQVQTDGPTYGPDYALFAPGLPLPGASLNIGNTVDPWAFYQRKGSAKLKSREQNKRLYLVELAFTTRPHRRCQTSKIEDPLLEPHRVKGSFVDILREALEDKDGDPLMNSSKQRFRGPAVQIEDGYPTVEVVQNVSWINLAFLGGYRKAVNNATFWGLPARTIRCDTFTWEQVQYGTCYKYFQVTTNFSINEDTWDLRLLDHGTMVKIAGSSPAAFRQAKDPYEENVEVLLNGAGEALAPGAAEVYLTKRVRAEKNFSAVGWPVSLL